MPRAPLTLALTLAVATPALSQATDFLALIDTNGDGSIARDEVVALRLDLFTRLDADADGSLTRAEVDAAKAAAEARRSARDPFRLDADGDGALTAVEFTATLPGFDRADQDGDGLLSPAEIDRVRQLLGSFGGGLE